MIERRCHRAGTGWRCLLLVVAVALCGTAARPAPATGACVGDCDGDGAVTVDEVVTLVAVALDDAPLTACAPGDANQDGTITVDEVVLSVRHVLDECPVAAVRLHAAVHFDQPGEPINQHLVGTGHSMPLDAANQFLRDVVAPSSNRVDVWFQEAGCPDGSVTGPLYDPETNTYNYCRLDERLAQVQAMGATPLLIFTYMPIALGEPECVASNGRGRGAHLCPPADYDKFGALIEATVDHVYTTFGVTEFEVWNEPDGFFFAGTLEDYLRIYETCNAAVGRVEQRLGRPGRTFILGGPATLNANRTWITALLEAAVAQPDLRVDFISWHNYANKALGSLQDPRLYAGTYADDTENVRAWLAPYQAQRPDLQPFLWINEWNVNAFYDSRADTAYAAAFLAAALHGMQDAGLDRSSRFNTWDSSPATPAGFNGNWGLFTHSGEVRPALYGLALWRRLAQTRVAVELVDAASQARAATSRTRYAQNLLAAVDAHDARATILLYNFVPYSPADAFPPYCGGGLPLDATIELVGLTDGDYEVTVQQVDCGMPIQPLASAALPTTTTVRTLGPGSSLQLVAPADSIVLVTLVPLA